MAKDSTAIYEYSGEDPSIVNLTVHVVEYKNYACYTSLPDVCKSPETLLEYNTFWSSSETEKKEGQ